MCLCRRHEHVAGRRPCEWHPLQPEECRRPLRVGHLQRQSHQDGLVQRAWQVEQRVDRARHPPGGATTITPCPVCAATTLSVRGDRGRAEQAASCAGHERAPSATRPWCRSGSPWHRSGAPARPGAASAPGVRCSQANKPSPPVSVRGSMTLRNRSSIGPPSALQQPPERLGGRPARARRYPGGAGCQRRHGCPAPRRAAPRARSRNRSSPLVNWLASTMPSKLEIVVLEHDAVVGRAPADMPTARGRVEPQPRILRASRLQVAHADDHMVDADRAGDPSGALHAALARRHYAAVAPARQAA